MVSLVQVAIGIIIVAIPLAGAQSFVPMNETFRPIFSHNLTGYVAPDRPLVISTTIRDSYTGFFRIYAWGPEQNSSDIDLWTSYGKGNYPAEPAFNSATSQAPEVITVRNTSSEYMMADPGIYTTALTTALTSGIAKMIILYVYRDFIDMGMIRDQAYSIREITIPPGLSRVIFICESSDGTDLDLFIQKGIHLPDSFSSFNYSSTSSCVQCWDIGIDYYVAEMLPIENPEPGKYLVVTYARGGDDIFMAYMMGIESEDLNPLQTNQTVTIQNTTELREKYRSVPFRMKYFPESEPVTLILNESLDKAFKT